MKNCRTFYLLLAVIILSACQSGVAPANQSQPASHSDHAASTSPRVPAFLTSLDAAGQLPPVLDPAGFDNPVVSKAYRIARDNPEIFAQQPCYCYCDDGFGHRSLLDCYATDHSAG
ncbi:MAG: hypothetical protein IPM66_05755 [Acidobacteriota bacterium]|nr:MAG: hypothetical protein IPM66_05755 [Acidobacteriota bacterium]